MTAINWKCENSSLRTVTELDIIFLWWKSQNNFGLSVSEQSMASQMSVILHQINLNCSSKTYLSFIIEMTQNIHIFNDGKHFKILSSFWKCNSELYTLSSNPFFDIFDILVILTICTFWSCFMCVSLLLKLCMTCAHFTNSANACTDFGGESEPASVCLDTNVIRFPKDRLLLHKQTNRSGRTSHQLENMQHKDQRHFLKGFSHQTWGGSGWWRWWYEELPSQV